MKKKTDFFADITFEFKKFGKNVHCTDRTQYISQNFARRCQNLKTSKSRDKTFS